MRSAFFLEIPSRAPSCFSGQESFTPGMPYYSLLVEDQKQKTYCRRDFCLPCWEKFLDEKRIYWKSQIPDKKKEDPLPPSYREKVLTMLRELMHQETEEAEQQAYVFALYLARQRLLMRRQEVSQGGGRYILYEVVGTEEMLPIKTVDLTKLPHDHLQQQLAEKLQDV